THRDTNTQTDRQRRHTPTGLPHLCSCAATCTESMMRRRASEICFARTVCCSNLVFTADWEIHSHTHTHTHTHTHPHTHTHTHTHTHSLTHTHTITGKHTHTRTHTHTHAHTHTHN